MTYVALDPRFAALLDPASSSAPEASVGETKPGMGAASLPTSPPYMGVGAQQPLPRLGPDGSVVLADDANPTSKHSLPEASPQPDKFSAGYSQGGYVVSETSVNATGPPVDQAEVKLPGAYSDVSIAVDVALVNPADDQYADIACRSQGADSEYRFAIFPTSKQFALNRLVNGFGISLSGLQSSAAIRDGSQTNRIELTCRGTTLEGSINGQQVISVSDVIYGGGGLWIGMGQLVAGTIPGSVTPVGSPVAVRFTNLVVTQR